MPNRESPENRLAAEKSPYLLQHAKNPVDWFAWGEEAFAVARERDVPIFLSIGYSTCHWCHVMERESFECPGIARVINENFVSIKVDREERPDVDQIYMQAVMAMTKSGGWPLNVFLTPDLEPFYGGTYFPPDARYGRPGFKDVLFGLAQTWQGRRDQVQQNAARLMEVLRPKPTNGVGDLSAERGAELSQTAVEDLGRAFDEEFGGFGSAPKFPRPCASDLLAHFYARAAEGETKNRASHMLLHSLEMMWRGGLYDHVGGGFTRYSTDKRWLVPHFEKMLYDNAQLLHGYLDGFLVSGDSLFADVVRDVIAFVEREMTHPEGGFLSAQDADSEGGEGKFYVFTPADLEEALGAEDAAWVTHCFGVTANGNFEGKNILNWSRSPAEVAKELDASLADLDVRWQPLRRKLYDWREERVRPGLDDKILCSWNGLLISGMARAGAVLGQPAWVLRAEAAADFVLTKLRAANGALLRRWREGDARFEASLDDYAFLAHGLLALFQATGKARWLDETLQLEAEVELRFRDPEGGYFFAQESDDLVIRMKEFYDGAVPSAIGMYALLEARLGNLMDDENRKSRAKNTVAQGMSNVERMPQAHPVSIMALREASEAPRTLVVAGNEADPQWRALLQGAHRRLMPGCLIIPLLDDQRAELLKLGVPVADKVLGIEEGARAWLCEDASCRGFA